MSSNGTRNIGVEVPNVEGQDKINFNNDPSGSNSRPGYPDDTWDRKPYPTKEQSSSIVRRDSGRPYRANGSSSPYEYSSEIESDIELEEEVESPSWEASTHEKYAMELERARKTNTKVAKTAVKGVATYFGGPAGGAVADTVNKSGVLDRAYNKIADATAKAGDFNPLAQHMQKRLNEADDNGMLDMADSAIDLVSNNAGGAVKTSNAAAGVKEAGNSSAAAGETTNARRAMPGFSDASKAGEEGVEAGDNARSISNASRDAMDKSASQLQRNANNKKKKDKEKKQKAQLINFIKQNPMIFVVLLGATVLIVLFIVLMAFLLGSGGYIENNNSQGTLDTRYDFNKTTVILTNSYTSVQDRVQIQQLMFEDLIKGATYAELYNSVQGLTKDQMKELFSAHMIVMRGLALNIGGYDSSTMQIEIQSGNKGVPYCDISNGCDVVNANGLNTYLISTYNGTFKGNKITSIPKAEGDVYQALNEAYSDTKYLVIVPKSFNEMLTKYDMGNPPYTQYIKEKMITKAKGNKNYETSIKEITEYTNYKIYNLESFAMTYNYSNNSSYWWPIGGKQDSSGLYSGTTTWKGISSPYGSRIHPITYKQSFHSGIDIPASQGTPIIATRSGKVTIATYNSSYGNYVEVDHGDGTSSRYAHMMNGGILVTVGQQVTQGQIIGKVGTTGASTGNHLHFEIRKDGKTVNPTDYVSADNQRPKEISSVQGVAGANNTQSVCLTLKNVGFSNNAVAAIMSNMHHESGFRLSALGDSGTSYGLCQWHNGRYTNLRNHCGSKLNTVECQIDYLIYELKNSYKGVYNKLLSNSSASQMTTHFCINFEAPANRFTTCPNRANSSSGTYLNYVNNGCK